MNKSLKVMMVTALMLALWTANDARAEGRAKVNLVPATVESVEQFDQMLLHSKGAAQAPAPRVPQSAAQSASASAVGAAIADEARNLRQASVSDRKGFGRRVSSGNLPGNGSGRGTGAVNGQSSSDVRAKASPDRAHGNGHANGHGRH